jgi:hypothetical protein
MEAGPLDEHIRGIAAPDEHLFAITHQGAPGRVEYAPTECKGGTGLHQQGNAIRAATAPAVARSCTASREGERERRRDTAPDPGMGSTTPVPGEHQSYAG